MQLICRPEEVNRNVNCYLRCFDFKNFSGIVMTRLNKRNLSISVKDSCDSEILRLLNMEVTQRQSSRSLTFEYRPRRLKWSKTTCGFILVGRRPLWNLASFVKLRTTVSPEFSRGKVCLSKVDLFMYIIVYFRQRTCFLGALTPTIGLFW